MVEKNKTKILKVLGFQKNKPGKKGFSLVETLLAVFIFSLAATLLAGSFSGFLKNYSDVKKKQRQIESAQYAINLIAKTIRSSTVTSAFTASDIWMYDNYSSNCVRYRFNVDKIQIATNVPADSATCLASPPTTFSDLTKSGEVKGITFSGTPSVAGTSTGKITIVASIDGGISSKIQTSVALRQ